MTLFKDIQWGNGAFKWTREQWEMVASNVYMKMLNGDHFPMSAVNTFTNMATDITFTTGVFNGPKI